MNIDIKEDSYILEIEEENYGKIVTVKASDGEIDYVTFSATSIDYENSEITVENPDGYSEAVVELVKGSSVLTNKIYAIRITLPEFYVDDPSKQTKVLTITGSIKTKDNNIFSSFGIKITATGCYKNYIEIKYYVENNYTVSGTPFVLSTMTNFKENSGDIGFSDTSDVYLDNKEPGFYDSEENEVTDYTHTIESYGSDFVGKYIFEEEIDGLGPYTFSCATHKNSTEATSGVVEYYYGRTNMGDGFYCEKVTGHTTIQLEQTDETPIITQDDNFQFEYRNSVYKIELPKCMSHTGSAAFKRMEGLKDFDFGNIKTIDAYAFEGCTSLVSLNLPDSLEKIGNGAFKRCTSLTGVTIPGNVEVIGKSCFSGCTNLSKIEFSNNESGNTSLNKIEKLAFKDTAIESIEIPNTVTEIDDFAFENCESLNYIKLPSGLTTIKRIVHECGNQFAESGGSNNLVTIDFSACDSLSDTDKSSCGGDEYLISYSTVSFKDTRSSYTQGMPGLNLDMTFLRCSLGNNNEGYFKFPVNTSSVNKCFEYCNYSGVDIMFSGCSLLNRIEKFIPRNDCENEPDSVTIVGCGGLNIIINSFNGIENTNISLGINLSGFIFKRSFEQISEITINGTKYTNWNTLSTYITDSGGTVDSDSFAKMRNSNS